MTDAEARAYVNRLMGEYPEEFEKAVKGPTFRGMFGYNISEDPFEQGDVRHPRYYVTSGMIGQGFYSATIAKDWVRYMATKGVALAVVNLEDYDWESNPYDIQVHKMADIKPDCLRN